MWVRKLTLKGAEKVKGEGRRAGKRWVGEAKVVRASQSGMEFGWIEKRFLSWLAGWLWLAGFGWSWLAGWSDHQSSIMIIMHQVIALLIVVPYIYIIQLLCWSTY